MASDDLTVPLDGGGCAGKIELASLRELIAPFAGHQASDILAGTAEFEDAGILRLADASILVFNVDHITPVAKDPFIFGQIAACNALSDLYAKGAHPLATMNILGYPAAAVSSASIRRILDGAQASVSRAGAAVLGGHSINSRTLFFGLACIGLAQEARIMWKKSARVDDDLVLTKPLGSGIIVSAQAEPGGPKPTPQQLQGALDVMATLNDVAGRAALQVGAQCATDVTGFGLIGHLGEVIAASECGAEIYVSQLPLLDGALELASSGHPYCSVERNRVAYSPHVAIDDNLPSGVARLLFDAQTSGGLLVSASRAQSKSIVDAVISSGGRAAVIGRVTSRHGLRVLAEIA